MPRRPRTVSTASNTSSSEPAETPRSITSAATTSSRSPSPIERSDRHSRRDRLDAGPALFCFQDVRMISMPVRVLASLSLAALASLPASAQSIEEKAQVCGACHGENGIPRDKSIPVIWGQHQGYVYIQLRDYKRGTRKNEQMTPIAE